MDFARYHQSVDGYLNDICERIQDLSSESEGERQSVKIDDIRAILNVELLKLLPDFVSNQIQQIVRHLRNLSISAYNKHDNAELALEICQIARSLVRKDTPFSENLEKDYAFLIADRAERAAKRSFKTTELGVIEKSKIVEFCERHLFPLSLVGSATLLHGAMIMSIIPKLMI